MGTAPNDFADDRPLATCRSGRDLGRTGVSARRLPRPGPRLPPSVRERTTPYSRASPVTSSGRSTWSNRRRPSGSSACARTTYFPGSSDSCGSVSENAYRSAAIRCGVAPSMSVADAVDGGAVGTDDADQHDRRPAVRARTPRRTPRARPRAQSSAPARARAPAPRRCRPPRRAPRAIGCFCARPFPRGRRGTPARRRRRPRSARPGRP